MTARLYRTLLSIQSDLNSDKILDGLDSSSNFQLSKLHFQDFGELSKCTDYNWYHRHFMFHCFICSLAKSKLFFFSLSLIFTLWSAGTGMSAIREGHFFFFSFFFLVVNYHKVRSSGNVYIIWLYLKTPKKILCSILPGGFWFMHVPFGSTVKFQFLTHFPSDHFSHPVCLNLFAIFAYDEINRFVSITSEYRF